MPGLRAAALLILALCAACSEDPEGRDASLPADGAEPVDGGEQADAAAAGTVQVGTGQERFESLEEGAVVPLVAGPQGGGRLGGYHIWYGVRTEGFEPRGMELELSLLDAATRDVITRQTRTLSLLPSGPAFAAWGIAVIMEDCCTVTDREVLMRVSIRDARGLTGEDELRVRTAPSCPAQGGGPNICP